MFEVLKADDIDLVSFGEKVTNNFICTHFSYICFLKKKSIYSYFCSYHALIITNMEQSLLMIIFTI